MSIKFDKELDGTAIKSENGIATLSFAATMHINNWLKNGKVVSGMVKFTPSSNVAAYDGTITLPYACGTAMEIQAYTHNQYLGTWYINGSSNALINRYAVNAGTICILCFSYLTP